MIVVSVYDKKAMTFSVPNFVVNTASAIRSFRMELNKSSPNDPVSSYPDDFAIYDLGTFDESTGAFINHDIPKLLTECSVLIDRSPS